MVSALHSSGRSKSFCNQDIIFGWTTIQRVWTREMDRAKAGLMREVPKLQERHIIRDSWTKLNVSPAKIMQVNITQYSFLVTICNCILPIFSKKR